MLVTLDQYGARIDDLKDWQRDSARQRLATLRGHAEALKAGRTSDLVARFEQAIAAQKGAAEFTRTLRVPELVGLAGEAKAEALLREALAIPGVRLTIPGRGATLALAQRVALSLAGTLKTPQWELVDSPAAWELYEAMAKQFPTAPDAAARGRGWMPPSWGATRAAPAPLVLLRPLCPLRPFRPFPNHPLKIPRTGRARTSGVHSDWSSPAGAGWRQG